MLDPTLVDRLRGIYTVPVNDGAGPLNGSDTFARVFDGLPPIQGEAADAIEWLLDIIDQRGNIELADGFCTICHGEKWHLYHNGLHVGNSVPNCVPSHSTSREALGFYNDIKGMDCFKEGE